MIIILLGFPSSWRRLMTKAFGRTSSMLLGKQTRKSFIPIITSVTFAYSTLPRESLGSFWILPWWYDLFDLFSPIHVYAIRCIFTYTHTYICICSIYMLWDQEKFISFVLKQKYIEGPLPFWKLEIVHDQRQDVVIFVLNLLWIF